MNFIDNNLVICVETINPRIDKGRKNETIISTVYLIFLKSTWKSVSIKGLSICGHENAKKC